MDSHIQEIDIESHFYTRRCIEYLSQKKKAPNFVKREEEGCFDIHFNQDVSLYHGKALVDALLDIGSKRIAAMDAAGVDVHIISLSDPAGVDGSIEDQQNASTIAIDANDVLFEATQQYPERLRGFAAIAPYHVQDGVKELERAINKLGFVGWLTHSNFGANEYLDDKKYWPLLEAAENLQIPIYIHPTAPAMKEFGKYGFALAGSAFGFELDAALCLMRMILGGVFDQFPTLQIILGHLGETMPFLNERLDHLYRNRSLKADIPDIKRIPSEVLHQNVFVTTSGRFYTPTLKYVIKTMGEDRVLFASDYPMESMKESVDFIMNADMPNSTKEKIFFRNAQRFLK